MYERSYNELNDINGIYFLRAEKHNKITIAKNELRGRSLYLFFHRLNSRDLSCSIVHPKFRIILEIMRRFLFVDIDKHCLDRSLEVVVKKEEEENLQNGK